jgi:hypothetical protein
MPTAFLYLNFLGYLVYRPCSGMGGLPPTCLSREQRVPVAVGCTVTGYYRETLGRTLHRSACFDSRAHHQLLLRDATLNSQHSSTGCACTISRQQLLCLQGLPLQHSISLFLSLSLCGAFHAARHQRWFVIVSFARQSAQLWSGPRISIRYYAAPPNPLHVLVHN